MAAGRHGGVYAKDIGGGWCGGEPGITLRDAPGWLYGGTGKGWGRGTGETDKVPKWDCGDAFGFADAEKRWFRRDYENEGERLAGAHPRACD